MSKTILIVDDNKPTLQMLAAIVESAGYTAITASNGEDALKIAREGEVSGALIDQYMEPMNGFTLARYFQLHDIKIPMIMVTGNENADLLSQTQQLGFATTIMKPVKPDLLIKVLQRFTR